MKTQTEKKAIWILAMVIVSLLLVSLPGWLTAAEDEKSSKVEDTRMELEKWIETQRVISAEKRDLVLAKEMLSNRIELVKRETETLRGKISETRKSIAETEKKRSELEASQQKLKVVSDSLTGSIGALESRIKTLLERLPEPVRDRVKPLSQRLPEEGKQVELSAAGRFQNIVGILNEVDKFNGDISVVSEVRTLADGSTAEVSAVYLGIGQGYYTGKNGTVAGVGTGTSTGWKWTPAADEAAARVAMVIAILKNEQAAMFVQLPIDIQ